MPNGFKAIYFAKVNPHSNYLAVKMASVADTALNHHSPTHFNQLNKGQCGIDRSWKL